ncbi:MAG: BamA/TamA family outer membrane protein [Candidatus Latescibacterota bacterium]|nr:MAG: BamA/TamA family outer membrane protein [Candidatus Latescibacterota bacterium]
MRMVPLFLVLVLPSVVWADLDHERFRSFEDRPITQIRFYGNNATKDFIITRELDLEVGDRLSLAALDKAYRNLENLGIFGSIQVYALDDEEGVTLGFRFREMPSFVPYVAFGYTEENGLSLGPAISSVNLTGRAIRTSGRLLLGGTTTFLLYLKYPWIARDYRLSLDLTAAHLVRDDKLNEFEETSDEFSPSIGRYLGEKGRLEVKLSFFRMHADRAGKTLSTDNTDHLFRVGGAIGWDSRDSRRAPSHGWQHELEVIASFGDGEFVTTSIDIRRFHRVAAKQTIFLGGLASHQTGTVGVDVPEYFQYRLGGANSIRGYDVEELGKTLFGKNQIIGTFEYQITLLPLVAYSFFKWSAALGFQLAFFADTGIAWSRSGEFSEERWKTGFGFGLRLLVPGSEMVRFDVGFNSDGDVRVHLGSWFKWTAQRFRLR